MQKERCMTKTIYCLVSLSLLTGCAAGNTEQADTSNPYYHTEKVKTDTGEALDKTTISGPPTPPKGYDRPVVIPDTANKKEDKAKL